MPRSLLFGLLLGATLLAYQPAWHGGVLWDDDAHLTAPALQSTDGLQRIWFDVGATQQYYPLVHSAFWVLHRVTGDNTIGYHLTNVVLHACSALLIAMILRRLKIPGAELAAALFALHPVHVESVAWMTELKNTLSGVLYLGAALVYLTFDERRRWSRYALALGLFTLALLSKTVVASLPVALLIVLWWQRGRIDWRRDVTPLVPFLMLGLASGLLTAWVERTFIGARGAEFQFSFIERCLIAGRDIWFYLGRLVWPANLMFIYPRWSISQSVAWQYLFPLGVALLLAAAWQWRTRSRAPLAALLFFIVTLAPALGFVNVYPFRFSFVADHFQYLASIGVFTIAAAGLATLVTRLVPSPRALAQRALAVVALPLAFLTWKQAHIYASADTLYRATIDRNPECWLAYHNLGVLHLHGSQQELDQAVPLITRSLAINTNNAEAHNSLGFAMQRLGYFDDARKQYDIAIELMPDFSEAYNNLGVLAQAQGHTDEAMSRYSQALQIKPGNTEAQLNLGMALSDLGRFDEAIARLRETMPLVSESPKAHSALGTALLRSGRVEDAIAQYSQALRLAPSDGELHNNLGIALETAGRLTEATSQYQEALRLNPNASKAHDNLGYRLFREGRLADAEVQFREAIRLQPDLGSAHYNLANVLQSTKRIADSLPEYREALRYSAPQVTAEVHNDYGVALAILGRVAEAKEEFRTALRISPDFADAKANLARAGG